MPRHIVLALLLVAAAGTGAVRAQDADAAQRAFVERYAAMLVAQDREGLKTLFHPASLACIDAENRDYYDFVFAKELSYGPRLRGGYTLTRFAPLGADAAVDPTGGMFPNPVQPTHEFQLDTPFDSRNRSLAVLRTIVARDGAWFIVLGCPTAQAVALFRERRLEGERQQAQAGRLADALRDPALSEIRDLLAHNRRIDAIKRYRVATDADLTTAMQVIDVLENR